MFSTEKRLISHFTIFFAIIVIVLCSVLLFVTEAPRAHAEAVCLDGSKPGDGAAGIIGGQAVVLCKDGSKPVENNDAGICPDGKHPTTKQNGVWVCNINGTITSPSVTIAGSCNKLISAAWQNVFCVGSSVNTSAVSITNWITDIIVGLLGIVLVITILVSAIQIITAGASPEALAGAKARLSIAALSLGLLIGLRAILTLIGV